MDTADQQVINTKHAEEVSAHLGKQRHTELKIPFHKYRVVGGVEADDRSTVHKQDGQPDNEKTALFQGNHNQIEEPESKHHTVLVKEEIGKQVPLPWSDSGSLMVQLPGLLADGGIQLIKQEPSLAAGVISVTQHPLFVADSGILKTKQPTPLRDSGVLLEQLSPSGSHSSASYAVQHSAPLIMVLSSRDMLVKLEDGSEEKQLGSEQQLSGSDEPQPRSLSLGVNKTEPETLQFVDPSHIHDTSVSSVYVDAIDPLSDEKHELHNCFVGDERSGKDDAIQDGSCPSELRKVATTRPCFVHLERLDIRGDLPVNVHQLYTAGPLRSESAEAVLSQADYSDVRRLEFMDSAEKCTQGTVSYFKVHLKAVHGHNFIRSVALKEVNNYRLYCEQCHKTGSCGAHTTTSPRRYIIKTTKCISCQKQFINKDHLRHIGVHHTTNPAHYFQSEGQFTYYRLFNTESQIQTDDVPYMCSHCDNTFIQARKQARHMSLHGGECPYQCSHCERTFTLKSRLKVHMEVHGSKCPYRCSECGKAFKYDYTLNLHMRYHTGERPYHCSLCDKVFAVKYNLQNHMQSHGGVCPYRCSQCDKGFRTPTMLKRHMTSHSQEHPYHCSQCDKVFKDKHYLRIHMKLHSGELQCTLCGKAFTKKDYLKRHMMSHSQESS